MNNCSTTICIPATTANLGSGFDVFGLALSLYNEVTYNPSDESTMRLLISGAGDGEISTGPDNLFIRSMNLLANYLGRSLPKGVITMRNRIPFERGLGSSSSAIVGGLYLANCLLGSPLSKEELLPLAIKLEGHPDNVAPALLGGLIVSFKDGENWNTISYEVPRTWSWIVLSPKQRVSTNEARSVLPREILHQKAVQNVGNAVAFISAVNFNRPELLNVAFTDFLHVPYRLPLIKGGKAVLDAALEAGAFASTVSGSGSTLLAVASSIDADKVCENMVKAMSSKNIESVHILESCTNGVYKVT